MDYDRKKVKERLDPHLTGKECMVCGGTAWLLIEHVWELPPFEAGRPGLPVVAMMCQECGDILFFSAVAVGAIEQS